MNKNSYLTFEGELDPLLQEGACLRFPVAVLAAAAGCADQNGGGPELVGGGQHRYGPRQPTRRYAFPFSAHLRLRDLIKKAELGTKSLKR